MQIDYIGVGEMNILRINILKWRNLKKDLIRYRYLYVLLLPALILMITFRYAPMYGIQIAFKDYKFASGIIGSEWVGLKYFARMFAEPKFMQVLINTIVISFGKLIFGFPAPIILALLLNEIRIMWFKRISQTISYLPHFISWIVLAGIFKEILSMRGPVNYVIQLFGGSPNLYIVDPKWFVQILISTHIWQSIGWGSIIYLAAISGIDKNLYEAAQIDGASRLKQMWHVTIPNLVPVIFILFLLQIGNLLDNDFDQIFNMYSPLVYSVGDVLDTYAYRVGLVEFNFSYSTAINLFKNGVGIILLLVVNNSMKKYNQYGV